MWKNPAVNGDVRLGGIRYAHVSPLGKEAVLRQLVQEGGCLEVLVVRRYGLRTCRLEKDQNDVALLLGPRRQEARRRRVRDGRIGSNVSGFPALQLLDRGNCHVDERIPDQRVVELRYPLRVLTGKPE